MTAGRTEREWRTKCSFLSCHVPLNRPGNCVLPCNVLSLLHMDEELVFNSVLVVVLQDEEEADRQAEEARGDRDGPGISS